MAKLRTASSSACPQLWAAWFLFLAAACGDALDGVPWSAADSGEAGPRAGGGGARLDGLAVCEHGYQDAVSRVLCADPAPVIPDLVSLERALGLDVEEFGQGFVHFALNSNSASVVARRTNVLNPRMVMFKSRSGLADPNFVALGFARGESLVELVSRDPDTGILRFYLLQYERACTLAPGGCTLADSLTEATEREWTRIQISVDTDLVNTPFDCLRCHQPDGPGTPKLLRMQELAFPWTHWITPKTEGGDVLFREFEAAHTHDERYGGVPRARFSELAPQLLEQLIRDEGFAPQPNEFNSPAIETELAESSGAHSPTWDALYAEATSARAIAVPHAALRATDAERQARAAAAYLEVTSGRSPPESLLDLRELLSLDAERAMNIRPRAGATGRQMVVQICGGCHNSRLDQTISRARFDVERLDEMTVEQKRTARTRLMLAPHQAGAMPPEIAAYLSEAERAAMLGVFD